MILKFVSDHGVTYLKYQIYYARLYLDSIPRGDIMIDIINKMSHPENINLNNCSIPPYGKDINSKLHVRTILFLANCIYNMVPNTM